MLWGKSKTTLSKVLKLHIKNADKREWDMIDRIYPNSDKTTNNNSKRFSGEGVGGWQWAQSMNRIFIQTVTGGIFVWHDVYNVPRNTKLQSVAERHNLVQEFCYLPECRADSAELGQKKHKLLLG